MTAGVLIVAGMIAVAAGLLALGVWVTAHPSIRGASAKGSGLMTAGFDEAFNPSAANARDAVDAETRLIVPAPTPDDDPGITDGRIRITLRQAQGPRPQAQGPRLQAQGPKLLAQGSTSHPQGPTS